MSKVRLVLASFLAATMLSGCDAESTSPVTPAAAPSYDNGLGLGSGNRSDTTANINSTTAPDSTDASGRNGLGLGSGN